MSQFAQYLVDEGQTNQHSVKECQIERLGTYFLGRSNNEFFGGKLVIIAVCSGTAPSMHDFCYVLGASHGMGASLIRPGITLTPLKDIT